MNPTAVELLRTGVGLINCVQAEKNTVVRRGTRIAGARHVLQAAVTLAVPELRILGAAADGLHAISMIAVAAASRRYRRPALSQAALATAFAVAETFVLLEAVPSRGSRSRRRR